MTNSRYLSSWAYWAQVGFVAAAYFGAARLGLLLAFEKTNASPVWPPSGIAFAAVLLWGYRVWPGILLGAFLANVVVFLANQSADFLTIVLASACIGLGNTLEPLTGGFLLHRWVGARRPFDRAQDVFKFVAVALLMCLVSASIGPTSVAIAGMAPWSLYGTMWFTWWLGDTVGVLIVTPVLLTWSDDPRIPWTPRWLGEIALLFVLLFFIGRIGFGGWLAKDAHFPLSFTPIPFLVWAAFRYGQRETVTATFLVSGTAIWDTMRGFGPFVRETPNTSLLLLQIFLGSVAVTVMGLAAVVSERGRAREALQTLNQELEQRVSERTAELLAANQELQAGISERKRAEEALRESEQRTRLIVGTAREAFIAIDAKGAIIDWNKAAEDTFGWRRGEILGQPLAETVIPQRYREAHKRGLKHFLLTGEGPVLNTRLELSALHRDGREFPVELTIAPVRAQDTYVFCAFLHDITERKRAEEELQAMNRELEAFTYSVSHDLRAPLRAMEGLSLALLEDYADKLDGDGKNYLQRVHAASRSMDTMIQDLLAYGRLGRADLQFQPVDLASIVEDALDQLTGELRKRVTLEEPLPEVVGHHATLVQVVANLLTNADKFVAPGVEPQVRVWAEERGESVRLWVEDNGIGIAPEHHERIFRVFERLHGVETYPGTGIGLATVRRAVERMGGRVGVESEVGTGSRFWVELPRREKRGEKLEVHL